VLALGEGLQLRNLVHMPALQAFTTRRFRFPFPFWMGGRYGVTPLPSKVPLVYVMGKPIAPPARADGRVDGGGAAKEAGGGAPLAPHPSGSGGGGAVPQSDIDALHTAYFDALVDLFRRYRHLHPHFADADLVLAYD